MGAMTTNGQIKISKNNKYIYTLPSSTALVLREKHTTLHKHKQTWYYTMHARIQIWMWHLTCIIVKGPCATTIFALSEMLRSKHILWRVNSIHSQTRNSLNCKQLCFQIAPCHIKLSFKFFAKKRQVIWLEWILIQYVWLRVSVHLPLSVTVTSQTMATKNHGLKHLFPR